jgi:hypothetical protein
MRDGVLVGGAVLPERPAARTLPCRLEQRVVAEAAAPARFERDPSARRPAAGPNFQSAGRARIGQGEREDAHVASAPPRHGHVRELAQQLCVVLVVGGVRARVASRADARQAAERLDLDARVVGERRQAGRPGGEPRLDPGVRLERQAVLNRLPGDAELVERDEPRPAEVEELA